MIEWIKNRIPEGQYQNKTEAEDETMGLIKAAKDAVSSMLADQWLLEPQKSLNPKLG